MRSSYLLLFTEISNKGGIQVFSKFFMDAVFHSLENADITVLLLNNNRPPTIDPIKLGTNRVKFLCCGSRIPLFKKIKFVVLFLWSVVCKSPKLIISNHISLLKVYSVLYPILKIDYGVVVHGIEVWNLKNTLERVALENARSVASVSRYTSSKINEQVKINGKIFPLPPPISGDRFLPQAKSVRLVKEYKLEGHKVILTVARLAASERDKGYDSVIKTLPIVAKAIPNVKYLLVGNGDDLSRVKTLAEKFGVRDKVVFCGFIPDERLVTYYNLCDVFVMPSKKEGFGIVFLEALACGKPVIAGNKDGSVDALLDGELGTLVDPDKEEEIAHAIVEVLRGKVDDQLLDGDYLRRKTLEVYGLDKFEKRVKEFMEEIHHGLP